MAGRPTHATVPADVEGKLWDLTPGKRYPITGWMGAMFCIADDRGGSMFAVPTGSEWLNGRDWLLTTEIEPAAAPSLLEALEAIDLLAPEIEAIMKSSLDVQLRNAFWDARKKIRSALEAARGRQG
jgi:hypothetical protein